MMNWDARVAEEDAACRCEPNGGGVETKAAPERAGDEDLRTATRRSTTAGRRSDASQKLFGAQKTDADASGSGLDGDAGAALGRAREQRGHD
jgi:hypothetical protein